MWNSGQNVKFLQESVKLNEFKKKLLLTYNLIAPGIITESTKLLLDVIIEKENQINPSTVLDLVFSDHLV